MSSVDDNNDDALDDRELPDASDMDQDGDDAEEETEPCPHCKLPVYAEAQHCPHCGVDISWERVGARKAIWISLVAAICLFVFVLYYVL